LGDEPGAAYRPLSKRALTAGLLGLSSVLALSGPAAWVLPAAGTIVAVWALRDLAGNPESSGHGLALAGLWLSLFFAAAGVGNWGLYRVAIEREGRQFARLWFRYLAEDAPQKALLLARPPAARGDLETQSWDYFRHDPARFEELQAFVQRKVIRTLLALGPKAQVRYYQGSAVGGSLTGDRLEQIYAVTFPSANGPTTFFIRLGLERARAARHGDDGGPLGMAYWCVNTSDGPMRPEGWE